MRAWPLSDPTTEPLRALYVSLRANGATVRGALRVGVETEAGRQAGAHDRIVQPVEGVPTVRPNRRAGRNEGVRDPAQIEWLGVPAGRALDE
jgi:hypothetical protein